VGLKTFIIKKHLISEGKHFFTNFTSFISIFGVSIGVASLLIVFSITSGFQKAYQEKILAHSGQIFVRKYGGIKDYKEDIKKINLSKNIIGATPMVYYQILISSSSGDKGAQLKGIDTETINSVANFNNMLSNKASLKKLEEDGNYIMVGKALGESLNLNIGDSLTITFPFDNEGKVTPYPKVITFEIIDFVNSGMYDFDSTYTYISLETAKKLFKTDEKIKGIEIKIDNIDNVEEIAEDLRTNLGNYPYVVSTYKEMYSNLFHSLQYQKIFIGMILVIIVILASFSIIGTLLIFVTEKEKDIALLKALGVSKRELVKLFMFEGATIGFIGVIMGFLIGFILLFGISSINVELNPDIYNITYIPVSIKLTEIGLIFLIAMVIAIASTFYPAIKAARLNPVDGILGRSINK